MVNKVEKIKIEDESNGNTSSTNPVTRDTDDNNLPDEIDNTFEDEEQVRTTVWLIFVTHFWSLFLFLLTFF